MSISRMFAVMVMVVSALAIAACGGMTKDEYIKETTKIINKSTKDAGKVGSEMGSKPTKKSYYKMAKVYTQAAEDLEALTPPSEVEKAHEHLVKGMAGMAGVLEGVGDKIEKMDANDPAEMMGLLGVMTDNPAVKDLMKADKEFKKAGYKVMPKGVAGGGSGDSMSDEEMEKAVEKGMEEAMSETGK